MVFGEEAILQGVTWKMECPGKLGTQVITKKKTKETSHRHLTHGMQVGIVAREGNFWLCHENNGEG